MTGTAAGTLGIYKQGGTGGGLMQVFFNNTQLTSDGVALGCNADNNSYDWVIKLENNSSLISNSDDAIWINNTGTTAATIELVDSTVKTNAQSVYALYLQDGSLAVTMSGNSLISAEQTGCVGVFVDNGADRTFTFHMTGGQVIAHSHAIQAKAGTGVDKANVIYIKPANGRDATPELKSANNNTINLHNASNFDIDFINAYLVGKNTVLNKTDPDDVNLYTIDIYWENVDVDCALYAIYLADGRNSVSKTQALVTLKNCTITEVGGIVIADGAPDSVITIDHCHFETTAKAFRFREYVKLVIKNESWIESATQAIEYYPEAPTAAEKESGAINSHSGAMELIIENSTVKSVDNAITFNIANDTMVTGDSQFKSIKLTNAKIISTNGRGIRAYSPKIQNNFVIELYNSTVESKDRSINVDTPATSEVTVKIINTALDSTKPTLKSSDQHTIHFQNGANYHLELTNVYLDAAKIAVIRSAYGDQCNFTGELTDCIITAGQNHALILARDNETTYKAKLDFTFTRCVITSTSTDVSYTAAGLIHAAARPDSDSTIKLYGCTLNAADIAIESKGDITWTLAADANGKRCSIVAGNVAITVTHNESPMQLNISDCDIQGAKGIYYNINANIYNITLTDVTIKATAQAIQLDSSNKTANSYLTIKSTDGYGNTADIVSETSYAIHLQGVAKVVVDIDGVYFSSKINTFHRSNGGNGCALTGTVKNAKFVSASDTAIYLTHNGTDANVLIDLTFTNVIGEGFVGMKAAALPDSGSQVTFIGGELNARSYALFVVNGITVTVNGSTLTSEGERYSSSELAAVVRHWASDTHATVKLHNATLLQNSEVADAHGIYSSNGSFSLYISGNTSIEAMGTSANAILKAGSSNGVFEMYMTGGTLRSGSHTIKTNCNRTKTTTHTISITLPTLNTTAYTLYSATGRGMSLHEDANYNVTLKNASIQAANEGIHKTEPEVAGSVSVLNLHVEGSVINAGYNAINSSNASGDISTIVSYITILDSVLNAPTSGGVYVDGLPGYDSFIHISGSTFNVANTAVHLRETISATVVNSTLNGNYGIYIADSGSTFNFIGTLTMENARINANTVGIQSDSMSSFAIVLRDTNIHGMAKAMYLCGTALSTLDIIGGCYTNAPGTAGEAAVDILSGITANIYAGYFEGNTMSAIRARDSVVLNIYGGYFKLNNASACEDTWYGVVRVGTGDCNHRAVVNIYGGTYVTDEITNTIFNLYHGRINLYSYNTVGAKSIYAKYDGEYVVIAYETDVHAYYENTPVMIDGAQVRLVLSADNEGGIRFVSKIDADVFNYAAYMADAGTEITFGTLIAPMDYVQTIPVFTADALRAAGLSFLDIEAVNGVTYHKDGSVTVRASISEIKEQNYDRVFAAVAYVKYTVNGEEVCLYSTFNAEQNARSLKQLATSAMSDTTAMQTTTYRFPVLDENGNVIAYSRFTDEQQAVLNRFKNCQYREVIVQEPTDTEPGIKHIICESCGTNHEQIIPPKNHVVTVPGNDD